MAGCRTRRSGSCRRRLSTHHRQAGGQLVGQLLKAPERQQRLARHAAAALAPQPGQGGAAAGIGGAGGDGSRRGATGTGAQLAAGGRSDGVGGALAGGEAEPFPPRRRARQPQQPQRGTRAGRRDPRTRRPPQHEGLHTTRPRDGIRTGARPGLRGLPGSLRLNHPQDPVGPGVEVAIGRHQMGQQAGRAGPAGAAPLPPQGEAPAGVSGGLLGQRGAGATQIRSTTRGGAAPGRRGRGSAAAAGQGGAAWRQVSEHELACLEGGDTIRLQLEIRMDPRSALTAGLAMGEGKANHQLSSPAAIAPRQRSPQAVSSLTRPRRPLRQSPCPGITADRRTPGSSRGPCRPPASPAPAPGPGPPPSGRCWCCGRRRRIRARRRCGAAAGRGWAAHGRWS